MIDLTGKVAYAGRFKLDKAQYSNAKWFIEAFKKPYYISNVFLGIRSRPHLSNGQPEVQF